MNLWVRRWLVTAVTLTALPLVVANTSYGQPCTPAALNQAIEQLGNNQKRSEARQTLTQCGEASVKPLANALSEPKTDIRLYAAQTLGQIGWDAKFSADTLSAFR